MSKPVISVEGLGKRYTLLHKQEKGRGLRHVLNDALTAPFKKLRAGNAAGQGRGQEDFWALKNVSFEINPGEVVGVVGRNGAGKSTLLKVLSRITEPTEGRIRIRGRVASLLEVGTGFHPELSGRENIFLNGAILGMSRVEIKRKFDEIVAFAEVERFLDTPVKRYSSGMYVRLAFAVAAHLEPEILIVDEVLAVGDAQFQKKCLGKMEQVATQEGRTILFVSHNMGAVRALCNRGVVMRQGQKAFDGPVDQALREYSGFLQRNAGLALDNSERSGSGGARLIECAAVDEMGAPLESVTSGMPVHLHFKYKASEPLGSLDMVMTVFDDKEIPVTNLSTRIAGQTIEHPAGQGTIVCAIPKLPFLLGRYRLAAALYAGEVCLDLVPAAMMIEVSSSTFFPEGRLPDARYCTMMIEQEWRHEPGHAGVQLPKA